MSEVVPAPPPGLVPSATASDADLRLPENAFRPLEPGEAYAPLVPSAQPRPRSRSAPSCRGWSGRRSSPPPPPTSCSSWGRGSSRPSPSPSSRSGSPRCWRAPLGRASTLLENVNVLAIGATSGIVAGGSVFTMPAHLHPRAGGALQLLADLPGPAARAPCWACCCWSPFRRYFTRDLHGKLPFPEARATTEILVAGNRGGRSAVVLAWSAATAAVYDFAGPTLQGLLRHLLDRGHRPAGRLHREDPRGVLHEHLGRHLRPRLHHGRRLRRHHPGRLDGLLLRAGAPLRLVRPAPARGARAGHRAARRHAGRRHLRAPGSAPSASAASSRPASSRILKMSPVILQAGRPGGHRGGAPGPRRGGRARRRSGPTGPCPCGSSCSASPGSGWPSSLYFRLSVLAGEPGATRLALVATVLTLGVSFLFAAVSAWAIALISITPISGMTLTTLIITAVALSALGLSGAERHAADAAHRRRGLHRPLHERLAGDPVQDRPLAGRHAAHHRDRQHPRLGGGLGRHHRGDHA